MWSRFPAAEGVGKAMRTGRERAPSSAEAGQEPADAGLGPIFLIGIRAHEVDLLLRRIGGALVLGPVAVVDVLGPLLGDDAPACDVQSDGKTHGYNQNKKEQEDRAGTHSIVRALTVFAPNSICQQLCVPAPPWCYSCRRRCGRVRGPILSESQMTSDDASDAVEPKPT